MKTKRSESGTTLIELIMTVAIMGFAMLAIMGGIGTSIVFASIQRQDAKSRLVLTTAGEKILAQAAPYLYKPCATTSDYAPLPAAPEGYTLTLNKVAFWDPLSNRYVASPPSSCPDKDGGLQLIRLQVTSSSGGSRAPKDEFLEVVKRQPDTT